MDLQIPYVVLGGGSNSIFADAGFRGLVIHMQARSISLEEDNKKSDPKFGIISAEAGALLSQVIHFALKHNLSGMERMTGIPGTVGGAARGNAGAFGIEMKDIVDRAIIYKPRGKIREVTKKYFKYHYRSSVIKHNNDIILKIFFKLRRASAEDVKAAMAEAANIIKNRISKQPKGKCSGSFFKNPGLELKAGYLLEQAGCKGLQVGKIMVSELHANWLINMGGGTQNDVLGLCKILKEKVKSRFKVDLEPEVQIVGATGFLNV